MHVRSWVDARGDRWDPPADRERETAPGRRGFPIARSPPSVLVETKSGPEMLVRALSFVFVGWWLSGIVAALAWAR